MKTFPVVILLLVALSMTGCKFVERIVSMTPEERYFAALRVYETTLDILIDLRKAGHIDDEAHVKITKQLIFADVALKSMKAMLMVRQGYSENFELAVSDFFKAITKIDKIRELIMPKPEEETP